MLLVTVQGMVEAADYINKMIKDEQLLLHAFNCDPVLQDSQSLVGQGGFSGFKNIELLQWRTLGVVGIQTPIDSG